MMVLKVFDIQIQIRLRFGILNSFDLRPKIPLKPKQSEFLTINNYEFTKPKLSLKLIIIFIFRVRIGLHWFVTRPFFDGFIMFVILLSSVALALEDPVKESTHPHIYI